MKHILLKSAAVVAAVIWGSIEAQATWTYDSSANTLSNDTGYSFTVAEVTLTDPETKESVTGFEIKSKAPSTATGDLDFTNVATETGTGKNVISFGMAEFLGSATCTKVIAPDVMKLVEKTFYNQKTITEVKLSKKLGTFPKWSMAGMSALTTLTPTEYPYITEITGTGAFDQDVALEGEFSFPSLTKITGANTFIRCGKITCVSMPKIEEIGNSTFERCSSLVGDLQFDELKSIGSSAFLLTSITSFKAPKVTSVGGYAFYQCESLKSVELNEEVKTKYGDYAFNKCKVLETLSPLPFWSNITNTYNSKNGEILLEGSQIINECPKLVGAVEMTGPAGLHTLTGSWLRNCNSITSVTIRTPWVTNVANYVCCNIAPSATVYWITEKAPQSIASSAFWSVSPTKGLVRIIVKHDIDGWTNLSQYAAVSATDEKSVDWPGKKTFGKLDQQVDVWLVEASQSFCIRIQ